MNFKRWIFLNENVEQNWNFWCDTLEKYARNNSNENRVLNFLKDIVAPTHLRSNSLKDIPPVLLDTTIIVKVLKEKNIENYNWFCFSLGCIVSYNGHMHEEDLIASIDETKRRIASGELPKNEIGRKGWLVIGSESKEHVDESIRRNQQVSKRKQEKFRKLGITLNEDPRLIKVLAEEGDFVLYLCPKIEDTTPEIINERHAVLCKYGKGGKFCTADPTGTYHRNYLRNNIYIFHKDNKVKYQFVDCNDGYNIQFMTVENTPPEYLEKEELDFLLKYKAPINCYNLKAIIYISYKDLIKAVRNTDQSDNMSDSNLEIFKNISINTVKNYLIDALRLNKKQDILDIIKGILYAIKHNHNNSIHHKFDLQEFIEELKNYDFSQEIIKEIIELLSSYKPFQYFITQSSMKSLLENSNLDNIELFFSKIKRLGILSNEDYVDLIKKHDNSQRVIEIVAKSTEAPITLLIALSKDKAKICNILRDRLGFLSTNEIIELLLGYSKSGWYTGHKKIETNSSGREMANALGSKVISQIKNPGVILRGLVDSIDAGRATTNHRIERSRLKTLRQHSDSIRTQASARRAEQTSQIQLIRDAIEGIAAKHDNLDKDDIREIIRAYLKLGIHKASQKITKILGKKNIEKLDKADRYLL